MSAAEAACVPEARWLGFPKGAWLIISVEFWERFSFYGMMNLLVLFLAASPSKGGFGWSATRALALAGWYSFAMYALPAAGGYLADRVLGRRRAVTLGATIMTIGQVMLASPTFLPQLLGWLHGAPLLENLHALGVPLGGWVDSPEVRQAIDQRGRLLHAAHGAAWLSQAYSAATAGFFGALVCLIVGNALMKSTLVVLCGETMSVHDPRRDGAFAFYYMGISLGAMLSGFVVGSVAQAYGWHFGFAIGAVGMIIALAVYVSLAPRWLGDIGVRPPSQPVAREASSSEAHESRREILDRITLLFVLAVLLCAFSVGWFQLYGSWLLFIERDVHRTLAAFTIPVPWFTSINALLVIGFALLLGTFWARLGERNRHIDIVQRYIFALATVTIAHVLLYWSAKGASPAAQAVVWFPVAALALIGAGEVVAWTGTYGMVSRAAPRGFASVAMGAWYLMTLGLGGYLSGLSGSLIDSLGFSTAFGVTAACMGVACGLAILLRAPLSRLASRAGVTL